MRASKKMYDEQNEKKARSKSNVIVTEEYRWWAKIGLKKRHRF